MLTALIGIVALRAYTHFASAEVFGAANLILGVLGLGFQALVQPVVSTQLRYHAEAQRAGRGDGFTVQILGWALLAATLVAALFLSSFPLWSAGEKGGLGVALALAAVFWAFVAATRSVFYARLHAEQRMASLVRLRVAEASLIALVTSALLALAASEEAFVWGQVIGISGAVLLTGIFAPWPVFGAFAHLAGREHAVPDFRGKLWRYGAPFAPMAGLTWLANLGDRYVLAALLGAAATGQYLAAFAIASQGFLLARGAMTDLFRPRLFEAETAADRDRAQRLFLAWLVACVGISLFGLAGIAVLGKWVVWLVLAEPYRAGAVEIMLWIGLGYGVSGLTTVLENRMLSLGHSAKILWPLGLGAVANIAFAYVLVSLNGVVGAAQACCMSFVLQFIATAFVFRRIGRRHS